LLRSPPYSSMILRLRATHDICASLREVSSTEPAYVQYNRDQHTLSLILHYYTTVVAGAFDCRSLGTNLTLFGMSLTSKPSKRDRLRQLFGRSPSPLPIRHPTPPAQTPSLSLLPAAPYTKSGGSILLDALQVLDHMDRNRIRALLPVNITDVDDALDEVCSYTMDLQQH
jgi:hypothetical protein